MLSVVSIKCEFIFVAFSTKSCYSKISGISFAECIADINIFVGSTDNSEHNL